MTDDDFELDTADEAQWNAIVSSEWPEAEPRVPIRVDPAPFPPGESAAGTQQTLMTIYCPRRPAPGPLVAAVVTASVAVWMVIAVLIPAYQLATAGGVSRYGRADDIHRLTVDAVIVAFAFALTVGCLAVWIVMYSRYRLRRSCYDQVIRRATPITQQLRPPNPATPVAWIVLLLATSGVATWWIPQQLQSALAIGSDPVDATQAAALGTITWLVTFALCAAGATTWACRETRHRARRSASQKASRSVELDPSPPTSANV